MKSNCSTRAEEHDDDGEVENDQEELRFLTVTLEVGPGLNSNLCSSSFVSYRGQNDKKNLALSLPHWK